MSHDQNELKRRTFLKSGLLAAAGASALGQSTTRAQSTDAPAEKSAVSPQGIPMRPFGKTGHTLPVLGIGGSAMVRMFAPAYGIDLLSMEERAAMVRHGYDRGIRYFDTARVYGESEEIMGAGLKGVRENCYIATKCHDPRPENVRQRVETSLEKLGVDWVDCVQIHSPAIERVGFEGAMKLHAELVKLKDEGLLKFIGLTTHIAFEPVHQMIATGGFDQVLMAYGYFKKGMDTMLSNKKLENRELCLAKAHDLGMAIVAMKVLGANIISHNSSKVLPDYDEEKRAKLPAAAIRWTLNDHRVSMLNIGVSYPSDVDKNLATLTGDVTYTNEDSQLLADFCTRAYESEFVKQMRVT